jgi:virulence-associated protein VagC
MATLTKIVRQGNSQALRIPAAFHLNAKEVEIHRTSGGLLILDPAERKKALDALRGITEKANTRRKCVSAKK